MNSVTVSSSNVSVTGCLLMPAWLIHIPTIWLLSLLIRAISANRVNARPLGRFWSGCAKSTKHGLEISGIGFIDVDLHNCFHLEAVQTLPAKILEQVRWTLTDWYLHVLRSRKEILQRLTSHVVVNAYFSKSSFVAGVLDMGLYVISRFRDDAYFRYLTKDKPTGGKMPQTVRWENGHEASRRKPF